MSLLLLAITSVAIAQDKKPAETSYTADSIWKAIELTDPGVKFEMPAQPKQVKIRMDKVVTGPPIYVHQHKVTVNRGTANFVFVYNDIPAKMDSPVVIQRTLDSAVQGANARVLGKINASKSVRHGKYPGREFDYTAELAGTKYRFSTKIVLVGQRLYQLNLIMIDSKYDQRMVRKFFDSFKLMQRAMNPPTAETPIDDASKSKPEAGSGESENAGDTEESTGDDG